MVAVVPAVSVCNVDSAKGPVNGPEPENLSDLSLRHKPWDQHRSEADEVADIYGDSPNRRHQRYAERVDFCAQVLEFARDPPTNGKQKLKLKTAWFCRVRHCPVCQWRRALQWQARLYQALPKLLTDFPTARFIFATFTMRNCAVTALRYTLGVLAQGWKRLIELRVWPALGWIRAVEITRSKDGTAHPHYHCLLMVPESYFAADYLKQREWAELWRECLRLNYMPIVDVRVIRQGKKRSWLKVNRVNIPQMWSIVTEILKYSVKPSDMMRDHQWFLQLSDQVLKTRAVAVGGVLKKYLREHADLTQEPGEDPPAEIAERLFFGWKQEVRRYQRLGQ
jgi:plasmid rolling circle replication initiator protein Rep